MRERSRQRLAYEERPLLHPPFLIAQLLTHRQCESLVAAAEAQQLETIARGRAKASVIDAEGNADALKISAQADADADVKYIATECLVASR